MRVLVAAAIVLVAAGCGEEAAPPAAECPARMVKIGRSCVDRLEADARGMPADGTLPASGISFEDAAAACRALGYRLCTGDEWTRACAGVGNARAYPYGERLEAGRCNVAARDTDLRAVGPAPGGGHPGCATPEGVLDLVGNVSEWTDEPDPTGRLRELRGGSYATVESITRCRPDDRGFQPTDAAFAGYGFRCCTRARAAASR